MSYSDDAPERHPLLGISARDAELDRRLRKDLVALRDWAPGIELANLLDDVLAGRRSLHDVARTSAFNDLVAPAVRQVTRRFAEPSPAEREALVEEGRLQQAEDRRAAESERRSRTE
jgi:hypothetical protein